MASRSILAGVWLHLGTPGGGCSPEMHFGCPEGSWGDLGAKMVPKMVPRGTKKPPDNPKTHFDQILLSFVDFFVDFWLIFD